LIHRNSPESRDSDDEMQRSLNRIEKRLKAVEGEGGKAKTGSSWPGGAVMENTTAAILAGLGTMLVVVAGLVLAAYRLADRG
jgi:hypothetical protein